MRRNNKWLGLAAAGLTVVLTTANVSAQSAPPPAPAGDMPFGGIGFQGFEAGFRDRTVTGSPFTATFSTQVSQTLSDGNQIQRTTNGTIARDSQGRTRRDMTLPAIGPWTSSGKTPPHVVIITDPVAGIQYLLQPDRKLARKLMLPNRGGQNNTLSPNSAPKARNDETATDLGGQSMNGVQVQGTRITRTIPVGAIGNQQPLSIISERWFSPDIQMLVMTKRTDPRTGQALFQLTDIQRNEPDSSLFQVPSDYTVRDSRTIGPRGGKRGGPGNQPGGPGAPPPAQD